MTKDEALDLALEALSTAHLVVEDDMLADEIHQAITAIKQARSAQQEPVALDGQRHLVEILAENWRVWPARKAVEQTSLGDVYCSAKGRDLMFGNHEIASDQDSVVVTKEMWSTMRQTLAAQPAPTVQEPVPWSQALESVWAEPDDTPPAAPVPLTDELEALFTNIDHAISSGAWNVQKGSQTWEVIEEAKAAHGITEKGKP
jgi:hypothetical protein